MSSKIKKRPTYTEEFKRQIVDLHSHDKRYLKASSADICTKR